MINNNFPTAGCTTICGNVLCSQYGCHQLLRGQLSTIQNNWTYTQPPRGCICPPGANKECENQYCPRKPVPPVSSQLGMKNE